MFRSLQQSMALLSQAKSESKTMMESPEDERQKQLKTAREIISNAIGDDPVGKKVNRICMGKLKLNNNAKYILLICDVCFKVENLQSRMEAAVAALLAILV